MLKKDRKKSWQIWQKHHLSYEPEITCRITRTEHFFIGRLQKYWEARGISKGIIQGLKWCFKQYKINKEPKKK